MPTSTPPGGEGSERCRLEQRPRRERGGVRPNEQQHRARENRHPADEDQPDDRVDDAELGPVLDLLRGRAGRLRVRILFDDEFNRS
jgi:hypothetical protein